MIILYENVLCLAFQPVPIQALSSTHNIFTLLHPFPILYLYMYIMNHCVSKPMENILNFMLKNALLLFTFFYICLLKQKLPFNYSLARYSSLELRRFHNSFLLQYETTSISMFLLSFVEYVKSPFS